MSGLVIPGKLKITIEHDLKTGAVSMQTDQPVDSNVVVLIFSILLNQLAQAALQHAAQQAVAGQMKGVLNATPPKN